MSDDKVQREPIDTPETPGGEKPEKVEDRPQVGVVEPEDYPETRKRS